MKSNNGSILVIIVVIIIMGIVGLFSSIANFIGGEKKKEEDTVVSTLENYFGKEGNFKVIETEMERGEMGQKYYIATVSTSYFDSTFTYNYNNRNYSKFLQTLCKEKYGVGENYLRSKSNPYFSAKKQEVEEMLKNVQKNFKVEYGYNLNDYDFENFGRLPSLEDINNKTEYFIYIHIFNPQNNYESILKDMKQILPFFKQKEDMTITKVYYYENIENYNKRPIVLDAEVYVTEFAKRLEIHIGDEYKTYIGNENYEFIEKEKSD